MPLFRKSAPHPGDAEPEDVPGYRDLRRIGHGGFSVVYRAHQEALRREVALKVVTVPLDDNVQRRFLREVMLTGRLAGHPNVVSVLDAGLTRSGRPYLAMDLHDRGSLVDRLGAGPLPAAEVAWIGARIAGALDAAHQLGIVHRDVKPSNILISRFGEPVLADFGVACLLDDQASATVLGTFTLRHAAPEVVNGGKPNAASDVYALGSTMYELLAGRPAFDGRGMEVLALMRRVLTEEPEPLTCPDLPALAGVVARAMAKRPQDRYPDAAALAAALAGLVPGMAPAPGAGQPAAQPVADSSGRLPRTTPLPPDEAPDAPPPSGPGDFADTALRPGRASLPSAAPAPARSRRSRTVLLAALGVVLVVGGAAGVVSLRHGSDGGQAAAPVVHRSTPVSHPTTHAAASATVTRPVSVTSSPVSSHAAPPPVHGVPGPGPGTTANPLPTTARPPAPPPPAITPPPTVAPVYPSRCTPSGCAGRAYFVAEGEHLFVCDQKADGYGAIAKYTRTDVPGQNNIAADKNGAGTCIDHNMNMPEGAKITFSICLLRSDGTIFNCSASITAVS